MHECREQLRRRKCGVLWITAVDHGPKPVQVVGLLHLLCLRGSTDKSRLLGCEQWLAG